MWWFILVWFIVAIVHFVRTFGNKHEEESLLDFILMFPIFVVIEFLILIDIVKYYIKRDKVSLERNILDSSLVRYFKRFFKRKD